MDLNEIYETARIGVLYLSLGWMGYCAALSTLVLAHLIGSKIKSKEELGQVIEEEAPKLGLDSTIIEAKYGSTRDDYAQKNGDGYEIGLKGNCFATRATVRHELCHILKDCDTPKKILQYYFLEEPRALLYGALKVRAFRNPKNKG